jgi:hypothetical protein
MKKDDPEGKGGQSGKKKAAAWGIAAGVLVYWVSRILRIDRPLKVEPPTRRRDRHHPL